VEEEEAQARAPCMEALLSTDPAGVVAEGITYVVYTFFASNSILSSKELKRRRRRDEMRYVCRREKGDGAFKAKFRDFESL
jgi:hypothetical protein